MAHAKCDARCWPTSSESEEAIETVRRALEGAREAIAMMIERGEYGRA